MWVCLNDAFLSVVQDRDNPDMLWVRARGKGHIEKVFHQLVEVKETPEADYRYRARVPRSMMRAAMEMQIDRIDYPNFKNSVEDDDLHLAYTQIWGTMVRYQEHVALVKRRTRKARH